MRPGDCTFLGKLRNTDKGIQCQMGFQHSSSRSEARSQKCHVHDHSGGHAAGELLTKQKAEVPGVQPPA